MSKITTTTWSMEPHTEAKHAILRKYLDAWLPIISRNNKRILYIDCFAGPGEYDCGKDGSPIIAINAVLEHRVKISSEIRMLFIEKDKKRCDNLVQKIAELQIPSNIKTECLCNEFDKVFESILRHLEQQKKALAPAFVFIDPFGFGVPFDIVNRVMENPRCEVCITFMYEEMNRFAKNEGLWPKLNKMFGTDAWKEVLDIRSPAERKQFWHDTYKQQLNKEAGIQFVRSFEMKNKANRTDYFLFFGTNSKLGLLKMKEAMWRVDRSGMFQFSDATYNPIQPMLFELEPSYNSLQKEILQEFKNSTVSIPNLEDFITTQTSFLPTHLRTILLSMENVDPPEIEVICSNRRKGTFPEARCSVRFL